jgi:hypothetical protein
MALTAWSMSPDGTSCGSGEVCSAGTCKTGCYVGGTFYAPNPYACEQCQPFTSTSSLTQAADGTLCGTGEVCHSGTCSSGCYIGGSYYAANAPNPSEPCQKCVPISPAMTTGWTALADGTSCNTGAVCKAATCTPGCFILGAYEAPNAVSSGECQSCQPAASTTRWSTLSDGTSCGTSLCGGGACDATTWSHAYFDYGPTLGRVVSARQTSDGGYLVLVQQSSVVDFSTGVEKVFSYGAVLLKLNASGAVSWGQRFPPPNVGTASAGSLTGVSARELGGAYYVLFDTIFAKVDTTGAVQWAKSIPGMIFTSLDVMPGGQLLLSANMAPSGVVANYIIVDANGVVQHAGYVNGTVGAGAIADSLGGIILFGNQQDPNGSVPWAGRVDPTIGGLLVSQLRFSYPAYNASDGNIVGAVETSPGSYVFAGLQTLYYPASSLNGADHPFVWASNINLAASTWATELPSTLDPSALTAVPGGGVSIVGEQYMSGLPTLAFLLELGAAGALTQANAYSNTGGPSFASISATSTPGLAIGGSLGGALVMSTKADGTVAGTCASGLGSSLSVTLQPFTLLTTPGVLKATTEFLSPTTATLSTVATDGFTLTAQCDP